MSSIDAFSFVLSSSADEDITTLPLSINTTSSNILSISYIKCVEIIILEPSLKLDKIVSKI